MSRIFILGDIHGNYKGLIQCFERCGFDYENDILIQLGDIVDGWSQSKQCVDELMKIKNLILIEGNHDYWFKEWLFNDLARSIWKIQGGYSTLKSFGILSKDEIKLYKNFFKNQTSYYIYKNCIFTHGGFDRNISICEQHDDVFMWDRSLITAAESYGKYDPDKPRFKVFDNFDEIFIGHTATTCWKDKNDKPCTVPRHKAHVWNLDTGSGWGGKLTIMDFETKEYWQSDLVKELYENESGRD